MDKKRQLLGVEIGTEIIRLCRFDYSGQLDLNVQLNIPKPAMPGAVTVAICENLLTVDPDFRANLVGVSLPGKVDSTGRILKSSTQLTEWIDVPLADWLEPRISRRVNLINSIRCLQLLERTHIYDSNIKKELLACFAAALLAYEKFANFMD